MGAAVDSIEDPLLRDMVATAARDLTTYLQANQIDPEIINPEGAAWFMVHAVSSPMRSYVWRELLAKHGSDVEADSRFDSDPAALAWARRKVQRDIDRCTRWHAESIDRGLDSAETWRRLANHMRRTFIGGEGCVIAAFDERLPQVREQLAAAVEPVGGTP